MNRVSQVTAISSVLLAVLFFSISVAHNGGYLFVLKLDSDVFSRGVEQVIYHGFLLFVQYLITPIFFIGIASAAAIPLHFLIIQYQYRNINCVRLKKSYVYLFWNKKFSGNFFSSLYVWPLIVFFLIALFMFLLSYFDGLGKESARELTKHLRNGNLFGHQYVTSKELALQSSEMLINVYCGSSVCVAMDINLEKRYQYDPKLATYTLAPTQCQVGNITNVKESS